MYLKAFILISTCFKDTDFENYGEDNVDVQNSTICPSIVDNLDSADYFDRL